MPRLSRIDVIENTNIADIFPERTQSNEIYWTLFEKENYKLKNIATEITRREAFNLNKDPMLRIEAVMSYKLNVYETELVTVLLKHTDIEIKKQKDLELNMVNSAPAIIGDKAISSKRFI